VVYKLGPGEVRLGPLFEFVMTILNLVLLFGIWRRNVSCDGVSVLLVRR
jgi:hypothetical protein